MRRPNRIEQRDPPRQLSTRTYGNDTVWEMFIEDVKREFKDTLFPTKRSINNPVMPFGKYAGEPVSSVPTGYLKWLLREMDLDEALELVTEGELERR